MLFFGTLSVTILTHPGSAVMLGQITRKDLCYEPDEIRNKDLLPNLERPVS